VPVLHASAVTIGGLAVALLGHSGVGKSTLCAELSRSGCDFVADDGLALRPEAGGRWRCFNGPPRLRLWPSALAGRLGIEADGLRRVHDTLEKRQLPAPDVPLGASAGLELAAVYVLDRRPDGGGGVELTPCSPRESVARLIEHSVAAAPAAALGLAPGRLDRLAAVAEAVPVRHLGFPSGTDSSRRILAAITRDLAGTRRRG
jgi:hypothetical protein